MTSGAAAGARAAQSPMQISQTLKRHNPFSSAKPPFVGPDDYHRFSAAGVAAAAADEAIVVKTPSAGSRVPIAPNSPKSMADSAIPAWLTSLPLAPEYHPTETEFADPITFNSRIERAAGAAGICSAGICKIIPPHPRPSKRHVLSNLLLGLIPVAPNPYRWQQHYHFLRDVMATK